MEQDVPRQTLDQPGLLVLGNASARTKKAKAADQELLRDRIELEDGGVKPVITDHVVLQLKDASGALGGSRDPYAGQDTSQQSADQPGRVIIDTESLKIEQIKGPDHLDEHSGKKGLQGYLQEGTIKPVTGDQVVYRLKQAGGAGSSGGSAAANAGGSGMDVEGAQVAVLGSPSVPVGLSSALGYMQLGQVARIKVPQHLMKHGAADDTGEITALPDSNSTPKAAAGSDHALPRTPVSSPIQQQQRQQGTATHAVLQQQRPPAAAAVMAGSSSSSEGPHHELQQQPRFSELQTVWRQRSLEDKTIPGIHPQQQQQQGVVHSAHHGSASPDIKFPHAALQPPVRHSRSPPSGLASAAPVSSTVVAAAPAGSHNSYNAAAAAEPAHRLESIPSDEVLPLPEAASEHSSWLPNDNSSIRSSFSSNADAAAAAGRPAGHLNGSHAAAPAGVAASPGTGSSSSSSRGASRPAELPAGPNSNVNPPGQQSPSGWSSYRSSHEHSGASGGGTLLNHAQTHSSSNSTAASAATTAAAAAAADRGRQEVEVGTGEAATAEAAGAEGDGGGILGLFNAPEALLKAAAQKLQQQFGGTEQDKQQQQYPEIGNLHEPTPAPAALNAPAAGFPAIGGASATAGSTTNIHSKQQQLRVSAALGGVATAAAGKPGVVAAPIPDAAAAAVTSAGAGSFTTWMDNSSSGSTSKGSAAFSSSTMQQQQHDAAPASSSKAAGRDQQQQLGRGSAGPGGGSGSDVATYGSNADAAGDRDVRGSFGRDAVEYELEVLAIVPGRGKLSGQPLLSDAARQQETLDVKGLTQDAHVAPHLQPPKPRTGCSGWVRRHLSLNVAAPWKAGKQGLGWLGLRGCCGGNKEEKVKPKQQEVPAVHG